MNFKQEGIEKAKKFFIFTQHFAIPNRVTIEGSWRA